MKKHKKKLHRLHRPVHHTVVYVVLGTLTVLMLLFINQAVRPQQLDAAGGGFDQFGYNYTARLFNGPADGVDRVLDGAVWGDATYAKDRLVMKWSKAWDDSRFNGVPWIPEAWTDNEWNGKAPGGSGEVWHYKIKWVGKCGVDGTPLPNGGYCIWGEFEVIMSQGSVANKHFWDAHAIPTGYGMHK